MDFDLGQVRAFVFTAEELQFTRAATRLAISQQAISKRVQRLEQALGESLFARDKHGVRLTPAGTRLLPYCQQLLAIGDSATTAARRGSPPLRLDIWGHVPAPVRLVAGLASQIPDFMVELSMRGSLPNALQALRRGEIDAAVGRVHDLGDLWPIEIDYEPIVLERGTVVLSAAHPLSHLATLQPPDLRPYHLWFPEVGCPPELFGFYRRLAEWLQVPLDTGSTMLELAQTANHLRRNPERFAVLGADWSLVPDSGLRKIPLHPTPCYLWSLVWRSGDHHPMLAPFRQLLARAGHTDGWLTYDPDDHWLPRADLTLLHSHNQNNERYHGQAPD